jgi:hypothetical protein
MVIGFKTIIKTYLFLYLFLFYNTLNIDKTMSEWKNKLDSEFSNSYQDDLHCTG